MHQYLGYKMAQELGCITEGINLRPSKTIYHTENQKIQESFPKQNFRTTVKPKQLQLQSQQKDTLEAATRNGIPLCRVKEGEAEPRSEEEESG